MLIEPLQDVCRLINQPEIEEELKTSLSPSKKKSFR